MSARIAVAVALQLLLMLAGLISPLLVTASGTTVYLETRPVDPRALFRGDYVTLAYAVGEGALGPGIADEARASGRTVYLTVTTERPAQLLSASLERPEPGEGQVCLKGYARPAATSGTVDLPQLGQYFVAEGEGREIERALGSGLLAEAKVSRRCNAVLVSLQPR